MSQDDPALAALIGSRICHDLASPLGAVANGIELLALSDRAGGADMALVEDSLRGARATLDLMRLAFGRAGQNGPLAARGLQDVLSAYFAAKPRLSLDWRLTGEVSRARGQILTLTCLAVEQALPRGGVLAVDMDGPRQQVTGRGAGMVAEARLWEALTGEADLPPPDPRDAQFHMLRACLRAEDMRLSLHQESDLLQVRV